MLFIGERNVVASCLGCCPRLGTLSDYDDDGSGNIAKKMNLRPFKLYRVYLEPLNSSNAGDSSCSNRERKSPRPP